MMLFASSYRLPTVRTNRMNDGWWLSAIEIALLLDMINHVFFTVLSKKYANLCEFARNRRGFGHSDVQLTSADTIIL